MRDTQHTRLTGNKQWWREARFGVFLHWTPTVLREANPAAFNGPEGLKRLPLQFNPRRFDADAWARVAKQSGAKYLIITAKHIDGFAMYHSRCSAFNIVDGSPCGRDILRDLVRATRRAGLRFGVYYNQDCDSDDPGGAWFDGTTEFASSPEAYEAFQQRKVIPQIRELLTAYGPIDVFWFDHPKNATPAMSARLDRLVRRLQPNCVVGGRLTFGLGDFHSTGDHQVPVAKIADDFEVCDTSNADWFHTEKGWKPAQTLLRILVDVASKGGNYLLNVGPKPNGLLPTAGVSRLRYLGRWLDKYGEAIYGSSASPFPYVFDWGRVTLKGKRLYLHFFQWPGRTFALYGLRNRVRRAYVPGARRATVVATQEHDSTSGRHALHLELPRRAPDPDVSVVALELDGDAEVEQALAQQPGGTVLLPAAAADQMPALYWGVMRVGQGACVSDWYSFDNWLSWTFTVYEPGAFAVYLETQAVSMAGWQGGHRVQVNLSGRKLEKVLRAERKQEALDSNFFTYQNRLGRVNLAQPGRYTLTLRALKINPRARGGLTPVCMRLVPRAARSR